MGQITDGVITRKSTDKEYNKLRKSRRHSDPCYRKSSTISDGFVYKETGNHSKSQDRKSNKSYAYIKHNVLDNKTEKKSRNITMDKTYGHDERKITDPSLSKKNSSPRNYNTLPSRKYSHITTRVYDTLPTRKYSYNSMIEQTGNWKNSLRQSLEPPRRSLFSKPSPFHRSSPAKSSLSNFSDKSSKMENKAPSVKYIFDEEDTTKICPPKQQVLRFNIDLPEAPPPETVDDDSIGKSPKPVRRISLRSLRTARINSWEPVRILSLPNRIYLPSMEHRINQNSYIKPKLTIPYKEHQISQHQESYMKQTNETFLSRNFLRKQSSSSMAL